MLPWMKRNMSISIVIALLIAAIVAEGAIIVRVSGQHGATKAKLENLKRERDQCALDLATTQAALSAAQKSLNSCVAEIDVAKQNQAAAIESIDAFSRNLNAITAEVRKTRETIYEGADCNAFAKMDIAAACPDLARSLRERARVSEAIAAN